MLYQPTAEKTTMIQPLTVEHFTRNQEVKKTRLSLIIVLSIQLVWIVSSSKIYSIDYFVAIIGTISTKINHFPSTIVSAASHTTVSYVNGAFISSSGGIDITLFLILIIPCKLSALIWIFTFLYFSF